MRGDRLEVAALQESVIDADREQIDRFAIDYSDRHVRLATVHTRQDIVLLVGYAAIIAKRLKIIMWTILIIAAFIVMDRV